MLATLAPDFVEAIVAGTEPSGLSVEALVKGMPMGWEEQRRARRSPMHSVSRCLMPRARSCSRPTWPEPLQAALAAQMPMPSLGRVEVYDEEGKVTVRAEGPAGR